MNDTHPTLDFLKILANDVRWKLIGCLSHSDLRVHELVDQLSEPQNLISYHLKHLREAHLVSERRSSADARDVYYSLDLAHLQQSYQLLGNALYPGLHPVQNRPDTEKASVPRRILFLCTHNSARSQMAEAILKAQGGSSIEVFSAGTEPAAVHLMTLRVLQAMGLETSQLQSKNVAAFVDYSFDEVITVCDQAREACPTFSGKANLIHWSIPDPIGMVGDETLQYQTFLHTARQLERRIQYFLARLNTQENFS